MLCIPIGYRGTFVGSGVAGSSCVVTSTNRVSARLPGVIRNSDHYVRWLGRFLGFYAPLKRLFDGFPEWADLRIRLPACNQGSCLANELAALDFEPRRLVALLGPASKFRSNRAGTSAVEFAIIAAPFFAILLGTLELALIFIVNTGLSVATEALATQIRTGQVQAPGVAATSSSGVQLDLNDAKTQLCNQIQIVSSATCMQQLQIDVRSLTSFQNTSSTSPISGSTFNSSNLCFYSGNAGDVVEMRAYYLYPLIDPLLSYAFSSVKSYISSSGSLPGLYYPIQTTQVFKSESYSGETNSGAGC
jgi:Flp pilus assembly protein TadG